MKKDELITVENLEKFREELLRDIRGILSESGSKAAKKWLKTAEVIKKLGISPGKLRTMRTNGVLPYTRLGGNIYYDQTEIDQMFERNKYNNTGGDGSKRKR